MARPVDIPHSSLKGKCFWRESHERLGKEGNFQIPGHLERETEFLYLWAINKMKSLLNVCEPPEESSKWKSRVLPPS